MRSEDQSNPLGKGEIWNGKFINLVKVSNIDTKGVDVIIEPLEEDLDNVYVEVISPNKVKRDMKPVNIKVGDRRIRLEFKNIISINLLPGIWKIGNLNYEYIVENQEDKENNVEENPIKDKEIVIEDILSKEEITTEDVENILVGLKEEIEDLKNIEVTEQLINNLKNILVDKNITKEDLKDIVIEMDIKENLSILLIEISSDESARKYLSNKTSENDSFVEAYNLAYDKFNLDDSESDKEVLKKEVEEIYSTLKEEYDNFKENPIKDKEIVIEDILSKEEITTEDVENILVGLKEEIEDLKNIEVTEQLINNLKNILVDKNITKEDLKDIVIEMDIKENLSILLIEISSDESARKYLSNKTSENDSFVEAYNLAYDKFNLDDSESDKEVLKKEVEEIYNTLKEEYDNF